MSGFQIYQIVAVQGQLGIIAELLQLIDVVLHGQMVIELSFQLCAPMPDVHECQQNAGEDDGNIAPMGELGQAGCEEHRFDHAEDHQNDHGQKLLAFDLVEIYGDQQSGHEHGDGDGKTVGAFHLGTAAEVQHHHGAADPQHLVDHADIQLSLGIGGVVDLHKQKGWTLFPAPNLSL